MEESNVDEFRDQFQQEAKSFIKQTVRENKGNHNWDSRNEARLELWLNSTKEVRGNVSPALFEYADRRSKGLEPPPGHYTWPGRSKERTELDRMIRQIGITQPPPEKKWREIDWNKSSSQTKAPAYPEDDEIDPSHPLEVGGWYPRSDKSGKISSSTGGDQSFPKARINFPSEKNKENDKKGLSGKRYKKQAEKWEQDLDNPEKDTEIPTGFFQHPGRPWTEDDEEQLLDVIEGGEHNFARIGQQIQRTEDDCHRKYQYLACLEVKEPRVGEWSAEQDAMLVRFVEEYKITDWDRIAFHCDTTAAEARQHWGSRKSTISSQSVKRNNSETESNLAVTSSANDALMNALDDMSDSNNDSRNSSKSSTAAVSSRDDSSQDDQSPSPMRTIPKSQKFEPILAAVLSGTDSQGKVAPAMVPDAIARGQKRGLAEDEEVNEGEMVVEQPKHKARRTETKRTGLESHVPELASVQILRRSSRPRKGERKYDSGFLWYDPHKTKSLLKKGVSNNPASQPATKQVRPKDLQASAAKKERHGMKKEIANGTSVTGKAEHGQKRPHTDVEEHGEAEPSRRKMRRIDIPKAVLKIRKNASAAPQAVADTRLLRRSSRLVRQEAADPRNSSTRPIAAPITARSKRTYGRQASPEADGQEEGLLKKTKDNDLRTAPHEEAVNKAHENPQDDQDSKGQPLTGEKDVGRGKKRGRDVESNVEEESQRKRRASQTRFTKTSSSDRLQSVATGSQEILERPIASEEMAGPLMQPRKPRHRAGLDRRMGNYPSKRVPAGRR